MAGSAWESSYSVGVAELDSHHQTILDLIGQLTDETWQKEHADGIGKAIDQLTEYVTTHFAAEEHYMEEFDYENYEAHLEQHLEYIRTVSTLTSEWMGGSQSVPDSLLKFLEEWWVRHILNEDKKYTKTLNDHGVT
jgi:hemerythrin